MEITVRLKSSELLYDIGNIAFITGDIMLQDVKLQSAVQDVVNDGNLNKVTRSLSRIFNELVSSLTAYTKKELIENVVVSDDLTAPENYEMVLVVPDTFSSPNANAVVTAAHDYMVNMALSDWFSITKKDEAQMYFDKAMNELSKINSYMIKRTRRMRRKGSPF